MRNFIWGTFFMSLLIHLLLIACGENSDGGDSDIDYQADCTSYCDKQLECGIAADGDMASCLQECADSGENMLDAYFESYIACNLDEGCTVLAQDGENSTYCYDENVALCISDATAYLEAACASNFKCDGEDNPSDQQTESCMDTMRGDGNMIICFNQSQIDATTKCIKDATSCSPDPVRQCVEDVLGLVLGSSSGQAGGGGNAQ